MERRSPSRPSKRRETAATRLKKPLAYLKRHQQPRTITSKTIALGGEGFGRNQAFRCRTRRLNRSGTWGSTCSPAQAAKAGAPPAYTACGLPTVAFRPAHGFYIWDFYSQHWGLYTANHLELGEAFCDHFISILPRLKEQTRQFYEWDGVFVPGIMGVDGSWILLGHNELLLWPGTTAWVAQAFWWQYLYGNDADFLREKGYPFMRECMLFYERLLEKGEDGKYHLNVAYAPEFKSWTRDDTLSLSLIRYLFDGMLKAAEILQIDEPHLETWREMLENLQEYHVDDSGLCFAEGLPYSESHRHMSHLAPVYPCDDVNIDGSPEERQLIDRTINNVILKGYGTFVGWAFVWLSAIAARAGRGKMAWWTLKQCADAFVSGNTYNLNLDWERNGISIQPDTLCVDGNMGAVDSLNQMLLQSWRRTHPRVSGMSQPLARHPIR